jgi:hypothetical protein
MPTKYRILSSLALALGIFTIFWLHSRPKEASEITYADLTGYKWVLVDNYGNPKCINHQRSNLVFLENQNFEMHKTFEFSGSTFRIPGKYYRKDSIIHLTTLNGSFTIGQINVMHDGQLKVQWKKSSSLFGKGTEKYKLITVSPTKDHPYIPLISDNLKFVFN